MEAFLSPQWANVTQWSNYLPQPAEILTLLSNVMPQRAKNIVNQRANETQWSNYLPQRAEIWIIFGNISRRWFTIIGLYLSINAFIPFPFSSTMLQSMEFNNNNTAVIFLGH